MRLLLVCLLLAACGTEENPLYETNTNAAEDIWVCHNPGSIEHNQVCTEECFEPGNSRVYCWLLKEKDCKINLRYEWQRQCCPLFREE